MHCLRQRSWMPQASREQVSAALADKLHDRQRQNSRQGVCLRGLKEAQAAAKAMKADAPKATGQSPVKCVLALDRAKGPSITRATTR